MGFPWTPIAGKPGHYTCGDHGGEWVRGRTCPKCMTGSATYGQTGSEAQEIAKAATQRDMPSMLDHEGWFVRISTKAERLADSLMPPRRAPAKTAAGRRKAARPQKVAAIAVQRLLETAIKARTRAADITEWREDWERTERHARNANRYARGHVPATPPTIQTPSGERN